MTDWGAYQLWGSTIPFGVVFGSLAPVFAYILVIQYCDAFGPRQKTCMHPCVFRGAKFLLGSQFNMPAKRPDQMNKVEATFIMSVFMELLIVTAYGLITFWNVALIEENLSANCVHGFDCFPFNGTISGRNLLQQEAISEDNCSHYESDEDVAIVCIRFVWKFTEAFGVAGGLVTLSLLLCKLHMVVISGLMSCCFDRFSNSCGPTSCAMFVCLMMPTLLLGSGTMAVLLLVLFGVPEINKVVLTDQTNTLYRMCFVSATVGLNLVGLIFTIHLYLQKLASNSTPLTVSRNQDPERIRLLTTTV